MNGKLHPLFLGDVTGQGLLRGSSNGLLGCLVVTQPYSSSACSESLHFVGLAISACLLPSLPLPTCTADSSAALTATAPVRSLVHTWPCSAPLQP
jgi:hypothetical protein